MPDIILASNNNKLPFEVDYSSLEASLREHIEEPEFPCVGAKSALATGSLRVVPAWSITSAWDDVKIHEALLQWSEDYSREPEGLRSLAVIFSGPVALNEIEFEQAMWDRLQSLADKDEWLGQPYATSISGDPADPHFSLSFGRQGYFVVGLHPHASRPARRTPHPTLIFNLHDQFVRLREQNRYERMREQILKRDKQLAGSVNPMLARHGESSEARQYSGREVPDEWKCPFKDPRAK